MKKIILLVPTGRVIFSFGVHVGIIASNDLKLNDFLCGVNHFQYFNESTFPVMLQFELTGACNLKCKQCCNDSGRKKTTMTAEHWKKFSETVADNWFSVTLSGGEPLLLGENLFELTDIFAASNTWINLISNGFFINRETARRLAKYALGCCRARQRRCAGYSISAPFSHSRCTGH